MIKGIFTLVLLFAITVFITHKGWHKDIFQFLDNNQDKANMIVSKTKEVAHDITKKDTVIVIQKAGK